MEELVEPGLPAGGVHEHFFYISSGLAVEVWGGLYTYRSPISIIEPAFKGTVAPDFVGPFLAEKRNLY